MLEVNKLELLKKLSEIQRVSTPQAIYPVLGDVLMEWREGFVFLTGTDLETTILSKVQAGRMDVDGRIYIPARKFFEIIMACDGTTLYFEEKENHRLHIRSGRTSFNLTGKSDDEYLSPPVYRPDAFTYIPVTNLQEMINKMILQGKPAREISSVAGVLFVRKEVDGQGRLRLVTTDGYRLALAEKEIPIISGMDGRQILVPKKSILELKRVIENSEEVDEIGIYFEGDSGFFHIGSTIVVARLIAEKFPDYEGVIPGSTRVEIMIDRDELYGCLKRMFTIVIEEKRTPEVVLKFRSGLLELSSKSLDFGTAYEQMDIIYEGDPFEVRFNVRYLLDGLRMIEGSTFRFGLNYGDRGPCMMKPMESSLVNHIYILMPLLATADFEEGNDGGSGRDGWEESIEEEDDGTDDEDRF